MGSAVMSDSGKTGDLLRRAAVGEGSAAAALFARYRERLKQMVRLRLDRRLQGRIDPSDVLQEVYLETTRRVGELAAGPTPSAYLWLRALTAQKLIDLMRHHLGTK